MQKFDKVLILNVYFEVHPRGASGAAAKTAIPQF
jgi:hypothetical protein